jgi:hypothetical protein
MDDFPPTAQDTAVKDVLSTEVQASMKTYQELIDTDVAAFNTAFKNEKRNYLNIE